MNTPAQAELGRGTQHPEDLLRWLGWASPRNLESARSCSPYSRLTRTKIVVQEYVGVGYGDVLGNVTNLHHYNPIVTRLCFCSKSQRTKQCPNYKYRQVTHGTPPNLTHRL